MKLTELKVARTVAAKPRAVFDVWMDPRQPGSPWFGTASLLINCRENELFYFAVEHEGQTWAHYGRFVRLVQPSGDGVGSVSDTGIAEYTWMSAATQGVESLVTVTFAPLGEGTEVTLVHAFVPDDEMGRRHTEGWTWMLNTLAERFSVHEEG